MKKKKMFRFNFIHLLLMINFNRQSVTMVKRCVTTADVPVEKKNC